MGDIPPPRDIAHISTDTTVENCPWYWDRQYVDPINSSMVPSRTTVRFTIYGSTKTGTHSRYVNSAYLEAYGRDYPTSKDRCLIDEFQRYGGDGGIHMSKSVRICVVLGCDDDNLNNVSIMASLTAVNGAKFTCLSSTCNSIREDFPQDLEVGYDKSNNCAIFYMSKTNVDGSGHHVCLDIRVRRGDNIVPIARYLVLSKNHKYSSNLSRYVTGRDHTMKSGSIEI